MKHIDWFNQPDFEIKRYIPFIFKVPDPTNAIIRMLGIGLLLSFFIPVVIPLPGGLRFLFLNVDALLGADGMPFQLKFHLLFPLVAGILLIFASRWKRSVIKAAALIITGLVPFLYLLAGPPVLDIFDGTPVILPNISPLVILPAVAAVIVILAGAHVVRISPYTGNKFVRNAVIGGAGVYFFFLLAPLGGYLSLYELYEFMDLKHSGQPGMSNALGLVIMICFFLAALLVYHCAELKRLSTRNARSGKHIANLWLIQSVAVLIFLGYFTFVTAKPAEMSGLPFFLVILTIFSKLTPWILGLFYVIPIGAGELFIPQMKKPSPGKVLSPVAITQNILLRWSSLAPAVKGAVIGAAVILATFIFIRGMVSAGPTAELFKQVRVGDLGKVRGLVSGSADLNAVDKTDKTPLHWAATNGHVTVVRELFQKKRLFSDKPVVNPNSFDNKGITPLLEASYRGYAGVVRLLLDNGANVDTKGRTTRTPLMEAARGGHMEVMKLLLAKGADVKIRNSTGLTALHIAALEKQPAAVALLIKLGAGVLPAPQKKQDFFNRLAGYNGFLLLKAVFRLSGESKRTHRKPAGDTANNFLHQVVSMGDAEVVRLLLEGGFKTEIDNKGQRGFAPLHTAVDMGFEDMVRVLLEAGADPNIVDRRKRTPLHYAVYHDSNTQSGTTPHWTTDRSRIVQLLIRHGADVNAGGNRGNSPLHEAVARGILEEVRLLVENGARIDARNDDGKTPLEVHMRTNDDDNHDRIRERNKINRYLESLINN